MFAPRPLLAVLALAVLTPALAGCGLLEDEKVEPMPMPKDPAVAVRPCDEDAASRVIEVYSLFGRLPSPESDRPTATRRTDQRWGLTVECTVPVRPGVARSGAAADPVRFTIFSSPRFEKWFSNAHLKELGAKLQTEYGSAPGQRILIAAKDDKAIEAAWVSDDGLVITVQSPATPLTVAQQRALLLAVADDVHETYAEPENLPPTRSTTPATTAPTAP